jgi:hypothetical protein
MKKELLLAAMGIASLTPGCEKTGGDVSSHGEHLTSGAVSSRKVDVDRLLKRLAEKPVPKTLSYGASCYMVEMPPDRAEYVCAVCGTKTIHSTNKGRSWGTPALSVKYYRSYIEQLKKRGLDVKLDESCLCSKCQKEGQSSLVLEVAIKGHVTRNPIHDINELRILIAFVQGELVWKGTHEDVFPLKPELPRICQLLGIEK